MKPESFNEHKVFDKLEQIQNRLQEDDVREKIELDRLSFYDSFVEYISERLKITVPVLVNEAELNALANELEAGLSQINAFLGNNNVGHLNNANNNFNSALNRIRNFPLPVPKGKYNFSKEIANFEKILSEKYELIERENKEFDERLKQLNSIIESKQQKIEELNNLLVQKQNEIIALTTNYKNDYNNIKATANQQFEQAKAKFRQEFDAEKQVFLKEKEVLKEEFETERANYEKEIMELKERISNNTADLIKELERKLEESKKLVNVIGNIGATGNYQKIADYHKVEANKWRWIALSFMVLLTGLLIYTIYHITGGDFNWKVAIVRIVAFSTLLYPATYASKESSKHRKLENINRKLELDIASISPFIEILPDEKKQEIKERMVEKFFGNNNGLALDKETSKNDELSVSSIEKLLKAFMPFLNK